MKNTYFVRFANAEYEDNRKLKTHTFLHLLVATNPPANAKSFYFYKGKFKRYGLHFNHRLLK